MTTLSIIPPNPGFFQNQRNDDDEDNPRNNANDRRPNDKTKQMTLTNDIVTVNLNFDSETRILNNQQ